MNEEKIKAWVTKYALTSGIEVVEGVVNHDISSKMFTWGQWSNAHRKDWHRSEQEAMARAEQMRQQKIESLRKSIKKLEALKFQCLEK